MSSPRYSRSNGSRSNSDSGPFRSVLTMIEDQVDRRGDRPAVHHDGRALSYRTLDGLANGLAADLAQRGVRKGDTIPVLLVSSLELPVAYLALMKLGAAFVPLDPTWPDERIRATMEVLAPRAILGTASTHVPPEHRSLVVEVDVRRIAATQERPDVTLERNDFVYGFFTSGTTGAPKCAINLHVGLANRLKYMSRYFGVTGDEVVLQNSKHTFDSSVWQLFWPLTEGGRTVLPHQGEFLDLHQTIDTIAEHGVTSADFVSSIFNALVATVESDMTILPKLRSLRWLIVGSEPINPRAVRCLMSLLPGLRITNGYGPTETSIGMAFHPMSQEDDDPVPVGKPIDNCYAVIVDDDFRPVPPGGTGEIAVGGACLGAGYLGAPAVTARAFVPNAFPERIPGDRLYLTGDLGRLDHDGQLYCLGRRDFQVKIGGVRIEPGEIEIAAESCPGVWQAEALVATEQDGTKTLAVCVAGDADVTEEAVLAHLRDELPRSNVPRRVVVLDSMPLSENGKVDRGELEHVIERRVAAESAEVAVGAAPETVDGRVLWAMRAALGRPSLGPDDNFMDAGGDSLKALTAVNAIRADLDLPQLCAQDLFDQPTASRLALLIEAYQADGAVVEDESELMERDSKAVPQWPAPPIVADGDLRNVLVTGATGFVGAQIVHELLRRTELRVLCVARAADDGRARERVIAALAERDLWEPRFGDRLECLAGDMSLPRLGLGPAAWDHLAESADLVLNCAALVNFLFDYRAHRRANVLGTSEALELAGTGRPVPFYQVSTLAALQGGATIGRPLEEDVDVRSVPPPPGGYNRSKWVAEQVLANARADGACVTILRLGEVMPSTVGACPNPRALTHLMLSAFTRLGARPDAVIPSDYTPVDYAAARIVAAVCDPAARGATLHVLHPASVSFGDLLARPDLGIERVSCRELARRVRTAAAETDEPELTALAALLPDPSGAEEELRRAFDDLLTDNPALYAKDRCREAERRWGMADGSLDAAMDGYLDHLARHYRARVLQATASTH
ncbi:MAG: non-ribosomal peptide synthetase [Frankiaceae bacterium]